MNGSKQDSDVQTLLRLYLAQAILSKHGSYLPPKNTWMALMEHM